MNNITQEELKAIGCTSLEELIAEDFGEVGTPERAEFELGCDAFIIGERLKAELTLTNPDVLEAIEATAKSVQAAVRRMPCTYSEEEVRMRLKESERDAIEGMGVSMDEVEALSNGWLA